MSLTVTQRPTTSILSNTCVHSAVGNPVLYKFQREDYQSNTLSNSAGNLRIVLTGDLTSVITVGDSVYYKSDNGVYSGYYEVGTISYSAPDTTITFVGGYTAAGTTGFINLTTRLNYKAHIEVYDSELISTLRVSPDSTGLITVDVSRVLWSRMNPDYDFPFNTEVVQEVDLYREFYIKYQGFWIGGSISQVDDVANKYFGVYAARQIRSNYGGYLAEYVSYSTQSAKSPYLLTPFTSPKIWRNLPFSVSAIFGQDIAVTQNFEITQEDISGIVIASNASTVFNHAGAVVTFNPVSTLQMHPDAKYIFIRTDRSAVSGLMDYVGFEIIEPCDRSILLQWTNSLGGRSWWCFNYRQDLIYTNRDGKKVRRMILYAENITLNEWESINELNHYGELFQNNIVEFTLSTDKTLSSIGTQVYLHDYRDSEILITSMQDGGGNIQFNSNRNFSYDNTELVYINTDIYEGYYRANPIVGFPMRFYIGDLDTNALVPYTSTPTYAQVRYVRRPVGVVVIPSDTETQSDRLKHSIEITVELPEIFTT